MSSAGFPAESLYPAEDLYPGPTSTRYLFTGPTVEELVPFRLHPPTRLVNVITYGLTVWRDASGVWQQKYGPSPTDLAGASVVYAGGRVHDLTAPELADLLAAGYGPYIVQEDT